MQEKLFYESVYDALAEVVRAAGGTKKVGAMLWPEKSADAAGALLKDCINPDRREKLDPEQVVRSSPRSPDWLPRPGQLRDAGLRLRTAETPQQRRTSPPPGRHDRQSANWPAGDHAGVPAPGGAEPDPLEHGGVMRTNVTETSIDAYYRGVMPSTAKLQCDRIAEFVERAGTATIAGRLVLAGERKCSVTLRTVQCVKVPAKQGSLFQ